MLKGMDITQWGKPKGDIKCSKRIKCALSCGCNEQAIAPIYKIQDRKLDKLVHHSHMTNENDTSCNELKLHDHMPKQ